MTDIESLLLRTAIMHLLWNVYFYFTIAEIREEEKNRVYLYDNYIESDLPVYEFYVSDTGTSKQIETDNGEIIISELGIAVYSSNEYDIEDLSVILNDKTRKMIEKGITVDNCYLVGGTSGDGYCYKCKTDILLDVEAVSAVNINGQIYSFK